MKKLICIFLLCFTSNVFASHWGRVNNIYNNLNRNVGLRGVHVYVVNNNALNAWTDGRNIYVTSRSVSQLNNNELAIMIGHEMAHILHGDSHRIFNKKRNELLADEVSSRIVYRSGKYNACKGGIGVLRKLMRIYGPGGSKDHSPTYYRLQQMYKYGCKG